MMAAKQITITAKLTVNIPEWVAEWGVNADEVRADAVAYFEDFLRNSFAVSERLAAITEVK